MESQFPSGIHIHYFMQEPHRILPSAIPTPPGSLGPHVALPKSPPILAHTWRLVPQETCQVGDPVFFSCSKSLIPAGVGTLASRSQTGANSPSRARHPRPRPGAPGRFRKQSCYFLLFRFLFGARRFSLLADCYLPIPAREGSALRAEVLGDLSPAGDPWGATEGLALICRIRRSD